MVFACFYQTKLRVVYLFSLAGCHVKYVHEYCLAGYLHRMKADIFFYLKIFKFEFELLCLKS
jgi:hypothetical protein